MPDRPLYRVRLRLWVIKPLNSQKSELTTSVCDRTVTVRSQKPTEPLAEAKWIVLESGRFATAEAAQTFGELLRAVTEAAGFCARLGVDIGQDQQTGFLNEEAARAQGLMRPEERIIQPVHGLSVFPDDGLNRFPVIEVTATVRSDPQQFLSAIEELGRLPSLPLARSKSAIRVLNMALLNPQPLAQIALAFSAIEVLGQDERWTDAQRVLIERLAANADNSVNNGGAEVADALRRGLQRVSLRQGVMRLLSELGLEAYRKEWDELYDKRSRLFHGTLVLPDTALTDLATRVVTLCGRIVLALMRQDGVEPASIAATHFPD